METTIRLLLLSGDTLVRFGAFLVIFYFVITLYRERVEGAPHLFIACVAVFLGEGAKAAAFTGIAPGQVWLPALLLTALGYCFAAYGFARLVRATIKRR